MTDHTPNNAPGPEPLSPAAQAVLDAFLAEWPDEALKQDRQCLAAALCAAADQVVPDEPLYGGDQRWMFERDARQVSRKKLRAIATELEGK
jgi:hypothetical protein